MLSNHKLFEFFNQHNSNIKHAINGNPNGTNPNTGVNPMRVATGQPVKRPNSKNKPPVENKTYNLHFKNKPTTNSIDLQGGGIYNL